MKKLVCLLLFGVLASYQFSLPCFAAQPPQKSAEASVSGLRADGNDAAEEIIALAGISGGLVVHVGCGDGNVTAELQTSEGCLVQGLDRSAANVAKAREQIRAAGKYGTVSVKLWDGAKLPYIDNLVNLLVVEDQGVLADAEILRVLAPNGVALVKGQGAWTRTVKPRPEEMDDWTHYLYDATGNPVSKDTLVAPPRHQQWVGGPRWSRHHDHLASMNAMVSSDGKLFYVFDEGPTSSILLPSKWNLIARDAFNGVVLWKKPIPKWWTRFSPLKSGPAQLPRKLVAEKNRLFITLGIREPVSKLDSETGDVLATYSGTENTWELLASDGLLFVVTGSPRFEEEEVEKNLFADKGRAPGNPINQPWKGWDRKLVVINSATDKATWSSSSIILPGTLAADADSVYFHNGKSIVALDKRTGKKKWVSEPVAAIDIEQGIPTSFMPSLVVNNGVVVFAGGSKFQQHMKNETDKTVGLDAKTGTLLWEVPHYTSGYQSPQDLIVARNTVISPHTTWQHKKDAMLDRVVGTDVLSGEKVFDNAPDVKDPSWFIHHRCHPAKATQNYLLLSKEGVEFVDLETHRWKIHHWVRGGCLYGIMPANGLLYAPMHNCACSADTKLNGLNALAAPTTRSAEKVDTSTFRLTKGAAFGKPVNRQASVANASDWPVFRGNPARTGVAATSVPAGVKKDWSANIGGKLTAPVVAGGRLYVAASERHTLYALDAATGKTAWTFAAEGRIDSPPAIHHGLVLFGSRDGCVYCLRAGDGELVWKFRAVAQDRLLMAWEQLESVWPVHGSVLVRKGKVWFAAGRSAFLDGGLKIFCLEPESGAIVSQGVIDGKGPDGQLLTGVEEGNLVGLPDILVASGDEIFMRAGCIKVDAVDKPYTANSESKLIMYTNGQRFDRPKIEPETEQKHLFSSYGFLDDSWFHRSYWVYGRAYTHGPGYSREGHRSIAGRIMVHDDENVYGFGREQKYYNWTTPMEYRLFAESKASPVAPPPAPASKEKKKRARKPPAKSVVWQTKAPVLATGLVLAGETLFASGAPDVFDETTPGARNEEPEILKAMQFQASALQGREGGVLFALSKRDGGIAAKYEIDAPTVFDGLVAANGSLYMALKDGTVQRWVEDPNAPKQVYKAEAPPAVSEPKSASFDFESGKLAPWKIVEGEFGHIVGSRDQFFGKGGTYNKQGNYYLTTLEPSATAPKGMDAQTGVIVSPLFIPKGGQMTFRVGGGSGANTYVALCAAGGKEVLHARGVNSQVMQQKASWDLAPYAGKEMFLRIVDKSTGGWGHITVDNVQFDGKILKQYPE